MVKINKNYGILLLVSLIITLFLSIILENISSMFSDLALGDIYSPFYFIYIWLWLNIARHKITIITFLIGLPVLLIYSNKYGLDSYISKLKFTFYILIVAIIFEWLYFKIFLFQAKWLKTLATGLIVALIVPLFNKESLKRMQKESL